MLIKIKFPLFKKKLLNLQLEKKKKKKTVHFSQINYMTQKFDEKKP